MHLHDKFVELCRKRGVDVATAYKAMDINKGTISVWKKCAVAGEPVTPSTKIAKKLAQYFEMPVEYFLYEGYTGDLQQEKKPIPENGNGQNYSDTELVNAFMQADDATRQAIRLLLKLK